MTDVERKPQDTEPDPQVSYASLRHELRTSLNAIIGYSEILLESAKDAGSEELIPDLEKIHAAGRQLAALLSETFNSTDVEQPYPSTETIGARLDFQLRTPLNAVIGYTELLLEDAEERGHQGWISDLQNIHVAATRFLALLGDVAGSDKIDAGETDVDPEPAGVSSVVRAEMTTAHPMVADDTDLTPAERGYLLVVDDNKANRDILSHFLKQQGYAVTVTDNGRQALEMIRTRPFDLILLDIIMPEMDGYQVLQRLKSDAMWRDIPVVMISALDQIDSIVRCIEMGAEDYLPKPFDPVLLNARISASLEKKRLRDQEVEYLRNVARVTAAAASVEAGEFEPESLADVAQRRDGLGRLARVFQSMAREVFAREQNLKQQVQELCIELSAARQARQVAEITQTEYFQRLQVEAQDLRDILEGIVDEA